jgi:hypothetical protein
MGIYFEYLEWEFIISVLASFVCVVIKAIVTDNSSLFSQVSSSLFPCELSKECVTLAEEAVEAAVKAWGEKSLAELEAEDRLSYACERVSHYKGC